MIEIAREDAERLASKLWADRDCGEPWESAFAPNRSAYTVFAIFTLAALQEADETLGSC